MQFLNSNMMTFPHCDVLVVFSASRVRSYEFKPRWSLNPIGVCYLLRPSPCQLSSCRSTQPYYQVKKGGSHQNLESCSMHEFVIKSNWTSTLEFWILLECEKWQAGGNQLLHVNYGQAILLVWLLEWWMLLRHFQSTKSYLGSRSTALHSMSLLNRSECTVNRFSLNGV